jgi:hypothetical protein
MPSEMLGEKINFADPPATFRRPMSAAIPHHVRPVIWYRKTREKYPLAFLSMPYSLLVVSPEALREAEAALCRPAVTGIDARFRRAFVLKCDRTSFGGWKSGPA